MGISRAALLDEIVKIAEESDSKILPTIKSILVGAGGAAAGYGLSDILANKASFFKNIPANIPSEEASKILSRRVMAAKILLPILSGSAVVFADRYRQKMDSIRKPRENNA